MDLSMREIQGIVERASAENPALLEQGRENHMWLFEDVRAFEADELVERLREQGLEVSKSQLAGLVRKHSSSESLYLALIDKMPAPPEGREEDFAWMALTVLWERWFPDVANAEMLDGSMQKGYALLERWNRGNLDGLEEGIAEWQRTWRMAKELASRFGARSVEEFDDKFGGTQVLFNWSQDFDMELENAETFGVACMGREAYLAEFDRVFPLSAGHPRPRMDDGSLQPLPTQGQKRRKIGRNEPCPCGSGKKYKKCCGR